MESIIAVSIAVFGWLVNHLLSLRAQKTAFLNQIRNNGRIEIAKSLMDYHDWLKELSQVKVDFILIDAIKHTKNEKHERLNNWCKRFQNHIDSSDLELNCVRLLEEYEPLFPGTTNARKYMREKHIELFIHYRNKCKSLIAASNNYDKAERIVESIEGFLNGAQNWIVRDFIVCIQNISLSEITGYKIPEKQSSLSKVKHTRLFLSKKNEIIIKQGTAQLPPNQSS